MNLLDVQNLVKRFPVKKAGIFAPQRYIHAVSGISFTLARGETLGLVGESGCGKTTTGRALLRLIEPSSGRILFEGRDVTGLNSRELKAFRRNAQMIFQDPFGSLNPRMTVGEIIDEPMRVHSICDRRERETRVCEVLETVGLEPKYRWRFPHEFSGGQRQRIGIARVLTLHPKLVVADEPVSALDVSIQAQIINLLVRLQEQFSMSYVFVSHDLRVVEHVADRVIIMYLGRIVESAPSREIYANAFHPYTQALLSAIPLPHTKSEQQRILLKGDLPSPADPPAGCTFRTRCPKARSVCAEATPEMKEVQPGHFAACHFV
ncbi:MAG: dipeptide ABC transporter ATP-binding protein [Deltaproteobacteria bacterium]|nr:dipeptide ABC transporter ATP-binding protein [Deltaproteobacteria bacterium]MBW2042369.1 dipeptide ABC transporter ATP-binding protein [Deltaproteobacteria bacterium]MBW2132927.1 dipeptide ABC transporter ATP-binding protein [Deltaproteobacteria bacterium]